MTADGMGVPTHYIRAGRDLNWEEFLAKAEGQSVAEYSAKGAHVPLESNEPLYILATSGTTAKPELSVHTHGGYQVYIVSMGKWVFGMRPTDIWWATSDLGWAVGHAYIVYAPLLFGCTTVAYEGALDYPSPETVWQLIEEFGLTGVFTSPTGVRLLMRYGEAHAQKFDLSSLERVVCAGEVLNAPAWEWLQKKVLHDRVPVIDHMWQTETAVVLGRDPGDITTIEDEGSVEEVRQAWQEMAVLPD
jgi:acetyl-CoA synthetase